MGTDHASTWTCKHCGGRCLKCGSPVDNDGIELGCGHHCRACRDKKRTIRLDISPHYCIDCGSETFKTTNVGRFPLRCPACNDKRYVRREPMKLADRECELCHETFTPRVERQRFCCKGHKYRAKNRRAYSTSKRSEAHRQAKQQREACPALALVELLRKRRYNKSRAGKDAARRYRGTERGQQYSRTRRRVREARVRGANGRHFTEADVSAQYKRQRGRCYWRISDECRKRRGKLAPIGKRSMYHADHVIPLDAGGSDSAENMVVACPQCNTSKGAKHPMEWAGVLC